MTAPPPVQITDRHQFDTLIDVRSPAEFAIDHIPGSINCPVLDDEQRRIVGTMYKQIGAFEARRVGGAMVAANIARHLETLFADKPAHWKPLVYCWRGGMRSGSLTTWLRLVGWPAQQLPGGYKKWRHHVLAVLDSTPAQLDLRVLCGATGSAKTRLLHALAARGEQVLDLECYAQHKGSIFGNLPGQAQPSQTAFDTVLVSALEKLDPRRPVYIEGESHKIGRITLPLPLLNRLRTGVCIEVQATHKTRLAYLLRDYAYLGDQPLELVRKMGLLKELHGKAVIAQWQVWALTGDLKSLFAQLMIKHYDPLYARSQSAHFAQWASRRTLVCDDLSEAGIERLAAEVIKV